MQKERLNGYWVHKTDPDISVYVEKVYKKGHVTGYKYTKRPDGGEVHSRFKCSHETLEKLYMRRTAYDSI